MLSRFRILAWLTLFLGAEVCAWSHDVTLTWEKNSEPEVTGYKVYRGTKPGEYTEARDAGDSTTFTVRGLAAGEYFFAVTAYTRDGLESGFSNEVFAAIEQSPSQPGAVRLIGAPDPRASATVGTITLSAGAPFTGTIAWGTTPELGQTLSFDDHPAAVRTGVLPALQPDTVYYFQVRMIDAAGNLVASPVYSFRTATAFSEKTLRTEVFPLPPGGTAPPVAGIYSGFAVANAEDSSVLLTFTAVDDAGKMVSTGHALNPTSRILRPGENLAELDSQIFGTAVATVASSVLIESTSDSTASIFLQFSGDLSEGDGGAPLSLPDSAGLDWILPEVDPLAENGIAAFNPAQSPAEIRVTLRTGLGETLRSVLRTVPPRGTLRGGIFTDFFPETGPQSTQYVQVLASSPVVVSGSVRRPGGWQRISAGSRSGDASGTLRAAQYVAVPGWMTRVSVVNVDALPGTVSVEFIPTGGLSSIPVRTEPIAPRGKLTWTEPGLFAQGPAAGVEGWLEIKGNGVRLIGSVAFGDDREERYSTALPLDASPSRDLLLPHVATDETFYTGLAVLNPGTADVAATFELRARSGALLDSHSEMLPARQRVSRTLEQWFPALAPGEERPAWLRIRAGGDISAFALFGTHSGSMLSAIPARRIR